MPLSRDAELTMAQRHVREGADRLDRQAQILERLKERGQPAELAEQLLEAYRVTLDQAVDHVRLIEAEIAGQADKGSAR